MFQFVQLNTVTPKVLNDAVALMYERTGIAQIKGTSRAPPPPPHDDSNITTAALVHKGNPSFATHFSLRAACRSQVREEVRVGRPFFGVGGGYCRGYPLRERTWHSELSLAMLWQGGCWLP